MLLSKVYQAVAGKIVGELDTCTALADVAGSRAGKSFKFYACNSAGTILGFWVWYTVPGYTSNNPVTGAFRAINVTVAAGSADTVVAAATRAALQTDPVLALLAVITGATNQFIITGRWPFNATDIVDVDSGFTLTKSADGSATVVQDISRATATPLTWVIRPTPTQLVYLRRMILAISDASGLATGTAFGSLSALTNGITVNLQDKYANILAALLPVFKTSGALLGMARPYLVGATYLQIELNFVDAFGGELPVDGSLAQEVTVNTNDALAAMGGPMILTAEGHLTSTLT